MKLKLLLVLSVLGVLSLSSCKERLPAHGEILVDCEIPKTEIFYEDHKLGETPCIVSLKDMERFADASFEIDDRDDWFEEGFILEKRGIPKKFRIDLLVPQQHRSKYLTYETPWGIRTKYLGDFKESTKTYNTRLFSISREDGLRLSIEMPDKITWKQKTFPLKIKLSNVGNTVVRGFRAECVIRHRNIHGYNKKFSLKKFELDEKWNEIKPGETLETEFELNAPERLNSYRYFAIYNLFQDENKSSNILMFQGSLYSESELLKVR